MIDIKILLAFETFAKLNDAALVDIAEHAKLLSFTTQDRLVAEKLSDYTLYLLQGKLDVQSTGGIQSLIDAGSERAQSPVFMSATPGHYARCLGAGQVLLIETEALQRHGLNHDRFKTDINYAEFETLMGNTSLVLFDEITEQFKSKSVTLPSLPELALYINAVLKKDTISIKRLAKIIQMDPVIAARVVQVANSSLYGNEQSNSIQEALDKIGVDGVSTIVQGVVLRDLFMPSTQSVTEAMIQFYEHSIRIGVICYALAKKLPGFDPDQAYMAGVLHDIGVVPILVVADRHVQISEKEDVLKAVLQHLKGYIGGIALQQWGFAEKFVEVAKHACDWSRQPQKADYCDLVQVALLHSHLVGGKKIAGPALVDLPAFRRLGLDKMNPVDNIHTLKELEVRIREMVKIICK